MKENIASPVKREQFKLLTAEASLENLCKVSSEKENEKPRSRLYNAFFVKSNFFSKLRMMITNDFPTDNMIEIGNSVVAHRRKKLERVEKHQRLKEAKGPDFPGIFAGS